jgi:hypothetical protein
MFANAYSRFINYSLLAKTLNSNETKDGSKIGIKKSKLTSLFSVENHFEGNKK